MFPFSAMWFMSVFIADEAMKMGYFMNKGDEKGEWVQVMIYRDMMSLSFFMRTVITIFA